MQLSHTNSICPLRCEGAPRMENFFTTGTQIKSLVVISFFRTVNNDLDIFDRDSTCIRQIIHYRYFILLLQARKSESSCAVEEC